jgi:hypothetical protein
MITQKQFHFLEEKIYDISTALFFSQSDAVLKYPPCIINIFRIDDHGQLWFLTPRPRQNVSEFEHAFISKMHFYKKGKNFYLQIEGRAFIVNDPEEVNCLSDISEEMRKSIREEAVLIKLKLIKALYVEGHKTSALPAPRRIKDTIYKTLFRHRPGTRPFKVQHQNLAY